MKAPTLNAVPRLSLEGRGPTHLKPRCSFAGPCTAFVTLLMFYVWQNALGFFKRFLFVLFFCILYLSFSLLCRVLQNSVYYMDILSKLAHIQYLFMFVQIRLFWKQKGKVVMDASEMQLASLHFIIQMLWKMGRYQLQNPIDTCNVILLKILSAFQGEESILFYFI